MSEITMPRLSDTMQEGKVARWLKQPGESVAPGDVLAEIETDKATMELEAYDGGVLERILVGEGETAPIGHAIAVLGAGGPAASSPQPPASSTAAEGEAASSPAGTAPSTPEAPAAAAAATPAAQTSAHPLVD